MAKYDLREVFELIDADEVESSVSTAVSRVMEVYSGSHPSMEAAEAENFIIDGLKSLTEDDFVRTVLMKITRTPADEYGLVYDNRDWYVKLSIETYLGTDERYVDNVSFHPPEKDLTTVNGLILKGQGDGKKI